MVATPSGTPIPTPMAVGTLVECSWVCAAAGEPVELLDGKDAGTVVVTFEFGPLDEMKVTQVLGVEVEDDGEGVRGGNPRTEPPV